MLARCAMLYLQGSYATACATRPIVLDVGEQALLRRLTPNQSLIARRVLDHLLRANVFRGPQCKIK